MKRLLPYMYRIRGEKESRYLINDEHDLRLAEENIKNVVKNELCTGCATCISLCPEKAIELIKDEDRGIYVPRVLEERCNDCGICYKVCPGHEVDFKQLNLEIFGKEHGDKLEDIMINNYINCYVGYSIDYNIRYNSSSGGVITQLLIFMLEEGIIDGALVTRMKKDSPLEPEPFIARTKEEIIEASKSKYCPVPANIALQEILNSKEGEKFAVVGLPCHIHGIRKAECINKKLKEKIVLHLGLFCNHTPTLLATEFLLKKVKVKKESVKRLDYRGEGWPGRTKISLENSELLLPFSWNFVGSYFFTPVRCFLCSDGANELSDISFADAWLPELSEGDKIGKTIIISRSELGEKLLQVMKLRKEIELNKISAKKVLQSSQRMLHFRKLNLDARIRLFNKDIKYDNMFKSNYFDLFLALFPFISVKVSKSSFIRYLMLYLPFRTLWLFNIPYLVAYSITRRKYRRKYCSCKNLILNKNRRMV